MLFRDEPKPGRALSSGLDACPITYSWDECCRGYWPYPLGFSNTLVQLIGSKDVSDTLILSSNTLTKLPEFVLHIASQFRDHSP